ncbi:MAG: PIN domain-containing protein, partial [Acidobacteriota bacterium]|nr:PIN domain-containing protein [Acidobacteriota bacterium]
GRPAFVGTNIFVYAIAGDDRVRSEPADLLIVSLMTEMRLRTSTQVLQELYVTLTRKIKNPRSPEAARAHLDVIATWPVIVSDYSSIREASELSGESRLPFWDALIVVAAKRAGAPWLYTEDLSHGQIISGVEVVNPFVSC